MAHAPERRFIMTSSPSWFVLVFVIEDGERLRAWKEPNYWE